MKDIVIQGKKVNYGRKPFIIAEAGVNHNGSLDLALKLVDAAAFACADAVKFQTFRAEQVVTTGSQLAMLRKLELKEKYYPALIQRAKERGIVFLSTPHGGFESVDFLQKMKYIGDTCLKFLAPKHSNILQNVGMFLSPWRRCI